jgi:anti-anti-sigma factor
MQSTKLSIHGTITIGEGDLRLRSAVDGALAEGNKLILLDFSRVTYLDSCGIGELAACFTRCHQEGAALGLVHLQAKVKRLLQMSVFLTFLNVYETEPEAWRDLPNQLNRPHPFARSAPSLQS